KVHQNEEVSLEYKNLSFGEIIIRKQFSNRRLQSRRDTNTFLESDCYSLRSFTRISYHLVLKSLSKKILSKVILDATQWRRRRLRVSEASEQTS
ncbi:TPA: hypothetical protein ACHU9Z_002027, partial [Shigella sonnei]